jgi:uncharacterized lipoprotein YmbA
MNLRTHARALALILGIVMFFQVGCAGRSRTSSFYVLSPEAATEFELQKGSGDSSEVVIVISPVSLPKYLKKSQIVTRTGNNELDLAEYDRWVGKIEEDIGRVIAENLSHILATDKVLSYPSMDVIALDYNIKIDIKRFDGRLGGDIELIARWAVFDAQGNTLYGIKATHITEPTKERGYAEIVAAQSRALASFSRELAAVIKDLAGS